MSARRAQPLPRAVVVAGVAIPLVLLAVVLGSALLGEDDPEPTAPFAADVGRAFSEANPLLLDAVETAGRWSTGDATDEELRGALDAAEATLPATKEAVAELDEPGGSSPAKAMYLASVDLYAVTVDALRAALGADGEARAEIGLLARRVRTLADRVYDRGRAIVDPAAADAPGITVVRSAPVPDWADEGLAASIDAGRDLDAEALDEPDDEPGRRRALRLLVLAEVERATALGLDEIAAALGDVATALPD